MEGMELSVFVKPGTVTNNFAEFKEAVRKELDLKYSQIEVSEERLQDAKKARARLNAAKATLKETMRSAQRENDEPLVLAKQQAKELEELLDGYIRTLDQQIKEIEAAQREERLHRASEIFVEILSGYSEEVQELAVQCEWVRNEKWGNATYSQLQVKKDCKEICDEIQTALQTFEGEFRPQMLADYIKNGNLAAAILFGTNLKRQKEAYEAKKKAQEALSAEKVNDPVQQKETQQEPVLPAEGAHRAVLTTEVIAPCEFAKEENARKQSFIDLRITAERYMIRWILQVMKDKNMNYIRITKEERQ